jgi:hypothetical protein
MHQYNKGHGRITQAAPPGASMARNALGASSRTAAEDLICTDDSVAVGRLAHGYELVSKQTHICDSQKFVSETCPQCSVNKGPRNRSISCSSLPGSFTGQYHNESTIRMSHCAPAGSG